MKCISLYLAFHLLFTGMASAWSPYSLTKDFLQRIFSIQPSSQIPQFVLDTRHPWLETNKAWLSRYPNVSEALCSRDSPLWTSPASPEHALPADLFNCLKVTGNGIPKDGLGWQERPSWSNVRHRLREMASCEAALADVQHLHVDIYVHDKLVFSDIDGEPTLPPPDLPGLFTDVLAQMSNLERLDWGMSIEATREFEPVFVEKEIMLPSVKYLQLGAGSDYLVSRCPNVEVLEAGDYFHHWSWNQGHNHRSELIKATTGLQNLKELRLSKGWRGWTLGALEGEAAFLNSTLLSAPSFTNIDRQISSKPRQTSRPCACMGTWVPLRKFQLRGHRRSIGISENWNPRP